MFSLKPRPYDKPFRISNFLYFWKYYWMSSRHTWRTLSEERYRFLSSNTSFTSFVLEIPSDVNSSHHKFFTDVLEQILSHNAKVVLRKQATPRLPSASRILYSFTVTLTFIGGTASCLPGKKYLMAGTTRRIKIMLVSLPRAEIVVWFFNKSFRNSH